MSPTEIAATLSRNGSLSNTPRAFKRAQPIAKATQAPVIDVVRVPPSACKTSQSIQSVRSPNAKGSMTARKLRDLNLADVSRLDVGTRLLTQVNRTVCQVSKRSETGGKVIFPTGECDQDRRHPPSHR